MAKKKTTTSKPKPSTPKTVKPPSASKKVAVTGASVLPPKKFDLEKIKYSPKLGDPQVVVDAYDTLIETLANMEVQQRNASKPYRIYFAHRRRAEVLRLNFIKSLR